MKRRPNPWTTGIPKRPHCAFVEHMVTTPVRLVAITTRTFAAIHAELGREPEKTWRWLQRTAWRAGKPIAVHGTFAGQTRTYFAGPPDWSPEKLAGYVAVCREDLEQAFGGPSTLVFDGQRPNWATDGSDGRHDPAADSGT